MIVPSLPLLNMKIRSAAPIFLSLLTPLAAQNFAEDVTVSRTGAQIAPANQKQGEIALAEKAQGKPAEGPSIFAAQDSKTLEARLPKTRGIDSVMDLAVLEKPSPFRDMAAGRPGNAGGVPSEGVKHDLDLISATYRESGKPESDCRSLSLAIEQRVKLDESKVLEIVEAELKANPGCSCEIVKSAIKASDADSASVVSIVETSINTAPEMMRIVSQCAIAVVPESLAGVQALLARYDPNGGDGGSSAKSAKSSKDAKNAVVNPNEVAATPNPLDFPGGGPVGPTPGGPGGFPLVPNVPPVIVSPPYLTEVNP